MNAVRVGTFCCLRGYDLPRFRGEQALYEAKGQKLITKATELETEIRLFLTRGGADDEIYNDKLSHAYWYSTFAKRTRPMVCACKVAGLGEDQWTLDHKPQSLSAPPTIPPAAGTNVSAV